MNETELENLLHAKVEALQEELRKTRDLLNFFTYECPYCHGRGGWTGFDDIHGEMDVECDYCHGVGRCNKAKDVR